jgi:hypothetical protein
MPSGATRGATVEADTQELNTRSSQQFHGSKSAKAPSFSITNPPMCRLGEDSTCAVHSPPDGKPFVGALLRRHGPAISAFRLRFCFLLYLQGWPKCSNTPPVSMVSIHFLGEKLWVLAEALEPDLLEHPHELVHLQFAVNQITQALLNLDRQ